MSFFAKVTAPSKATSETLTKEHISWNKGLTGNRYTAEHCAKIGAASKGRTHSAESRAKMRASREKSCSKRSESLKKHWSTHVKEPTRNGAKHSAESIEKMRQAHKGKTHSAETRAKLRAANLGKKNGPMSIEQKLKIRAAHANPVMTYYGVYPSVRAVAEAAGVSAKVVSGWMKRFPKHYYYVA